MSHLLLSVTQQQRDDILNFQEVENHTRKVA